MLELDDKEFEILVDHLLTAVGFKVSEVTGKTGDGGVDAIGELNVANLAKVKILYRLNATSWEQRSIPRLWGICGGLFPLAVREH